MWSPCHFAPAWLEEAHLGRNRSRPPARPAAAAAWPARSARASSRRRLAIRLAAELAWIDLLGATRDEWPARRHRAALGVDRRGARLLAPLGRRACEALVEMQADSEGARGFDQRRGRPPCGAPRARAARGARGSRSPRGRCRLPNRFARSTKNRPGFRVTPLVDDDRGAVVRRAIVEVPPVPAPGMVDDPRLIGPSATSPG